MQTWLARQHFRFEVSREGIVVIDSVSRHRSVASSLAAC
jgi:hypothetical protein